MDRLVDSKAAGRIIKAAAADFAYYHASDVYEERGRNGLIEVKETEHLYRLARDKVPQLARMRKRSKCGGFCFVLIFHSISKKWRLMTTEQLAETGDKGSWNLSQVRQFDTLSELFEFQLGWKHG